MKTIMNSSWSKESVQKRAKSQHLFLLAAAVVSIGMVLGAVDPTYAQQNEKEDQTNNLVRRNPSGASATISTTGSIDFNNPFFQSLGTNGRTCATCHQPADGWSISARNVRSRFFRSRGEDPIFRPIDGANCPTADVSTMEERIEAYSLLLRKGLIRIPRTVSPAAQFSVVAIDDPYQCSTPTSISLYRRPLPATNLKFLSTVMWDARETLSLNFPQNLLRQALHATLDHAEPANAPDASTLQQIVTFELALFTAQVSDKKAQSLTADGAIGGPEELSIQNFFLGINGVVVPFDNHAFNLYANWSSQADDGDESHSMVRQRLAIARGEDFFNNLQFELTGVPGFSPGTRGFCTTCHNSPNAGDFSAPAVINIGTADGSRRTADLPLFTLQDKNTGAIVQTTDPGGTLFTGRTVDIGAFKTPVLRGLGARAPYFHDGSAATLEDVVDFYNQRFKLGLTEQQKSDMAAFLRAL